MKAGPRAEPTANRVSDAYATMLVAREHDQRVAARVVASRSTGIEDCRELLDMLGLTGVAGLPDPPGAP